jgi:hypothetical protein
MGRRTTGEVNMFATIKRLIPEPRHADQPRHYLGRHRQPATVSARAAVTVTPRPEKETRPAQPQAAG